MLPELVAMQSLIKFAESFPLAAVFKKCRDKSNEYIVVLVAPETNTLNNESRPGIINPKFAKFRSNGLIVLGIININSEQHVQCIQHISSFSTVPVEYRVGTTVFPSSYCVSSYITCGPGIHYFKTVEAALNYSFASGQVGFYNEGYDENGKYCADWWGVTAGVLISCKL